MHGNEMHTDVLHNQPDEHVEGEQTYLRVAEIVLADALQPLKAREIVDRGIERGLFGDHVLSRTPEKSMQARLSTDILNKAGQSKFIRTERGRFTLRSKLLNAEQAPDTSQPQQPVAHSEYVAERPVLRTPSEEVLCVGEHAFKDVLTFQGIDTDANPILRQLLEQESISYVSRSDAEVRNDVKQFITYVLVQCGQRLLFFRRSYLSRAAEFLRGSKCIVTLKGRLRVTAAEGVRAAVLANAGIAIASEWMFAPEIADGTVKAVLRDWELPGIDLWAVYPAGRTATTTARTFTSFVQEVMHQAADAGKSA